MRIDIWWKIIAIVILFALVKQCESEQRVITKTETQVKWKTDTVVKTIIRKEPVYVEKVKTIKGDTVIVYKDKPIDKPTIEANVYKTELKSNNATASLEITANELYDIKGTITYPEVTKTVETIKIKDKSGLYIYAKVPATNFFNPEVGALYQIRNKIFISGGIQYNSITNKPDLNIGLGVKIL
jgi:uncharacterized protein YcfL